jgi:hypothetical protein
MLETTLYTNRVGINSHNKPLGMEQTSQATDSRALLNGPNIPGCVDAKTGIWGGGCPAHTKHQAQRSEQTEKTKQGINTIHPQK